MIDEKISEVLSDFNMGKIQMEDLKKKLGEAVLENYKHQKDNKSESN